MNVVVQRDVGKLLADRGEQRVDLVVPGVHRLVLLHLLLDRVDPLHVVDGLGPKRTAHVVVPPAVGALPRDHGAGTRLELGAVALRDRLTHGLALERVASDALIHVRHFRGSQLGLLRRGVHSHEAANVKIDRDGHHRHDVSLVLARRGVDGPEQDTNRLLVAVLGAVRVGAVLGPAHLAVVPAEHRHVGGGDEEQSAVGHRLHRAVE